MTSDSLRQILLVDCDAFFVAVARLEDPDGVGQVERLIVGGRPDGRGVVASASYPAREKGVRSGMPMSQAVLLCPDAVVVPVPIEACRRKSREIRAVLDRWAPVVEMGSIDEAYLDLSASRALGAQPLDELAQRIRLAVLNETNISVSIGGGTSRLVAKLASGLAKPRAGASASGVFTVAPGDEAEFMKRFALIQIPGIGPAFAEELSRRGLVRVTDALDYDVGYFTRWLGERRGRWLYQVVRGIDRSPVGENTERKSISNERTFAEDVFDDAVLEQALHALVHETMDGLNALGMNARTVTVKLRDGDFTDRQMSRTLQEPFTTKANVLEIASYLLTELRRRRRVPVRLLGVGFSNLKRHTAPAQASLFGNDPTA